MSCETRARAQFKEAAVCMPSSQLSMTAQKMNPCMYAHSQARTQAQEPGRITRAGIVLPSPLQWLTLAQTY